MVQFIGTIGICVCCFSRAWGTGVCHGGISIKITGVTVLAFVVRRYTSDWMGGENGNWGLDISGGKESAM